MKTFIRIAATTGVALAIMTTGLAGAATLNKTCSSDPVKTIASSSYKVLNTNNTKVVVGNRAYAVVNGHGNCVVAGTGNYLQVNGNDNYVSAGRSSVYITGSSDVFNSNGGNYVDCGGNNAALLASDASNNCNQL